jgi:ATP-dependent helicase/nuclease subunit B
MMASMPSPYAAIGRGELFSRLGEGLAADIAVVTPNLRLAQSLQAELDRRSLAAGRASWEAADILPLASFLERCHGDATYSDRGAEVPSLLEPAEEQLLWEEAVRASAWRDKVLSASATASLAAGAWMVAHDWRIEGALDAWPGNEDAEAFAHWRRH